VIWCPLVSLAHVGPCRLACFDALLAPQVLTLFSVRPFGLCVWSGRGGRACRADTTHTQHVELKLPGLDRLRDMLDPNVVGVRVAQEAEVSCMLGFCIDACMDACMDALDFECADL
jgi:hypothetical protein